MLRNATRTQSCLPSRISFFATAAIKPPQTYISTPIFYVNAAPHIGHVHSAVLADALSRWHKIKGCDVLFTTGTDEHGLKVQEAVEKSGTQEYQAFCDEVSSRFIEIFQKANVDYSRFIRTSDQDHNEAVNAFWRTIYANGYIYLGDHESWYCKSDESFVTETQVEDKAGPDGNMIKVSKESGHPVEMLREQNYKFRLSKFQNRLLEWLDANPDAIVPKTRYNEVRAAVTGGLKDLSVSRLSEKIRWAIQVPDDNKHCVYVWLDALTNYLTSAGYPGDTTHSWPAAYHIVGKDILKFHAIYWPAFLMAAGLPLPKKVVAHAHWTVGNVKMSKSRGNVIDPNEVLSKYGSDFVRFFLLRESVLTNDSDFNTETLEDRVNSELADTLGNLVSRCTSKSVLMSGKVPKRPQFDLLTIDEKELVVKGQALASEVKKYFDAPDFARGLETIVFFLHDVNRYFTVMEPWILSKTLKEIRHLRSDEYNATKERLDTVLYLSMDAARISATLLQPVVPIAATKILDYLGVPTNKRFLTQATLLADGELMGAVIRNTEAFVAFPKVHKNSARRTTPSL
ncbi:methionine-trna ligase [Plasmopara halstedii]|uniref:methionine--tRNA ligase n=1 Tax=Plasmopara halstedii TaxID=4781 RepID=A0A0P1AQD3_PLAHL|nr:methionine-trna ligase [Plasmopara halstedii]CEG43401.1 methionine-trna ligase [Plasmopara halstedii]|eukprot:XP_024579770.1 methionine-trna ligase [Plasmopara halstedii]